MKDVHLRCRIFFPPTSLWEGAESISAQAGQLLISLCLCFSLPTGGGVLPLHQQEQCLAPCGWEHAYLADTGHPGHSGHLTLVKEGCGLLSCPLHEEVVDFVIITHRAVPALPDQHRGHKLSVWGHRARGGDWRPTQNGESFPASVPSHSKLHRTPEPHLLHAFQGNAQCATAHEMGGTGTSHHSASAVGTPPFLVAAAAGSSECQGGSETHSVLLCTSLHLCRARAHQHGPAA